LEGGYQLVVDGWGRRDQIALGRISEWNEGKGRRMDVSVCREALGMQVLPASEEPLVLSGRMMSL
jgi:hypothetical protein